MNKRIIGFLLILTIFIGGLWYLGQKKGPFITLDFPQTTPGIKISPTRPPTPQATLVLDVSAYEASLAGLPFEERKVSTYSGVGAKNALEILKKVASKIGAKIKVKKYDFGAFVEEIAGIRNTKNYAWIYFVNGQTPDVSPDNYKLREGDLVEWKYIKIEF